MHTDNHWNDEASKLCPVLGAGELTRTNHECFPCQTFPTYQGWQLSCIPRGRWIQEGLLLALSHWGAVSWFEDTVLLIIKGSLLFWLRIHQGIMSMLACLFAFQWDWCSQVLFQAGLLAPWQSCSSVPRKAYENVVVLVFWRAHHESRNQDCFSELENNQNSSCFYCHFVFSVSGLVRTFWILSRGMMLADLPAFWDAKSK